ncbi:MAG: hypothetical protein IKN26_06205 [Eubacterium sp.]|nr:hypothetical protein [Eubacterium sp.]
MKKRKRFYNNKKRNQKWTEEETGRKIAFADKYIENSNSSDKFDSKRPKSPQNVAKKKAKKQKILKNALIALICLVLISAGYTGMDVYMAQKEGNYNPKAASQNAATNMSSINLRFSSLKVESISLDSSVMLSSVIKDTQSNGFTSITFDAKRSDGTIGYVSSLASVDTFRALSSPASKPKPSIKELLANDILPIARISCYKDNVAPKYLPQSAITKGKSKLYKDENENTYLNPESESAYNYIRDIIVELSDMGVEVFLLSNTDLPEEISKDYQDGFKSLSQKLYNDVEADIKLIEETDAEISGKDPETGKITYSKLKEEVKKLDKLDKNKTYYISTRAGAKRLAPLLEKRGITNYIIDIS